MFPLAMNVLYLLERSDIMRDTKTDINHEKYYRIKDFWTTDLRDGHQELPDEWIGTTTFDILRPDPGPNKVWIDGRLTILHSDTGRPGHKNQVNGN